MNYLLNIENLIRRVTKRELRGPRMIDMFKSMLEPVESINVKFVAKTEEVDYFLQFNGQTIYLEHYLNDQYDNILRRIFIENTATTNRVTIYFKSEGQAPTNIFFKSESQPPAYLRWRSEPVTSNDFIVWVPSDITYDETVMRSQIDLYRIAGKLYTIQTF